jgi:hypothetical protein
MNKLRIHTSHLISLVIYAHIIVRESLNKFGWLVSTMFNANGSVLQAKKLAITTNIITDVLYSPRTCAIFLMCAVCNFDHKFVVITTASIIIKSSYVQTRVWYVYISCHLIGNDTVIEYLLYLRKQSSTTDNTQIHFLFHSNYPIFRWNHIPDEWVSSSVVAYSTHSVPS